MDNYSPELWDPSFAQLPDDQLLAILNKQFPENVDPTIQLTSNNLNPQFLSLTALTPPSDESSPSPPQVTTDPNTRNNSNHENEDPALKRKASYDDDDDEGPNHKNPHIGMSRTFLAYSR
jgi:AP-1-like transcription factor